MNYKELRELFWPVLERLTDEEKETNRRNQARDILKIKEAGWSGNSELALEEAKKLIELEGQRRGSADSKAAIYLAAITALAPVLVSLIPGILSNDKNNITIVAVSFLLLFYAIISLFRAALWAFETLKVSASNRVDIADLVKIWEAGSDKHREKLTIENLYSVRKNREGVNRKVTCIKMTHELILRTFFAFIFLLFIQTLSSLFYEINVENQTSSSLLNSMDSGYQLPVNVYKI